MGEKGEKQRVSTGPGCRPTANWRGHVLFLAAQCPFPTLLVTGYPHCSWRIIFFPAPCSRFLGFYPHVPKEAVQLQPGQTAPCIFLGTVMATRRDTGPSQSCDAFCCGETGRLTLSATLDLCRLGAVAAAARMELTLL